MQLFISHASEDKDSFVRPLAEALKVHFEVWYDEYKLTLGDSLLRKINAGLASSDYGVVVLSPAFFQKKWPQTELDGLYALEQETRKVILPIWKDIDAAGVRQYSPILAGRLAVPASDGIDRVVAEIKRAVDVSERSRELSQSDNLALRLKKLALTLQTRKAADAKLWTPDGVRAIEAETEKLCQKIEKQFKVIGEGSGDLKFAFHRNFGSFEVQAPFRLCLQIRLTDHAINNATNARLHCIYYQLGRLREFDERDDPRRLHERTFRPYFGEESQPIWTSPNSTAESMTTEQVVATLAEQLIEYVEKESRV